MRTILEQIQQAAKRIEPYTVKTPLIRLSQLDSYLGCQVYAKCECMQITGSFKLRGAMNMIMGLDPEQLKNGIVTASSGNHGRGCAYAAKKLGIPATVVVPDSAPPIKVENIRRLGAEIVQCPAVKRFEVAEQLCQEKHAEFIPPYNAEQIMAGQGTAGLEIMEQLPEVDMVVIPVSGGGLIGGVSAAIKETDQRVTVIGVEPAAIPRYTASLQAGEPVTVEQKPTIADALVSNHPGTKCFPMVQKYVDRIATAEEEQILQAQKLLLTEGKIFAEASGCLGIAGVLAGRVAVQPDQKVCFLISGGNCSIQQLEILNSVEIPKEAERR